MVNMAHLNLIGPCLINDCIDKMDLKFKLIPILFAFTSCTTYRCYRGIYATEKLLLLDNTTKDKIIASDTLYVNNNIYLNKALFNCSDSRTRELRILGNLKDSTVLLVPFESDFINDSILFVNTQFFISPLNRGIIVTTKKEGSETHYKYPEEADLYALTAKLKKEALYKLENKKFVFVTSSISQEAFKKHCTNATCFVPSPGLLYDQKINLTNLKSVNSLDHKIESWLDNLY